MTDIRTTEEIEVNGEYQVRVAETDGEYEAAVVGVKKDKFSRAVGNAMGDDSEWSTEREAPRVVEPEKYYAVGVAVEAYREWLLDEDGENDD